MTRIRERLQHADDTQRLADACLALVEQRMATISGVSGLAVRAARGAAEKARPGFLKERIAELLPEFAGALEEWLQHQQRDDLLHDRQSLIESMAGDADQIAEGLLRVTDERAAAGKGPLSAVYGRIRGHARTQVVASVPEIAAVLSQWASQQAPGQRS